VGANPESGKFPPSRVRGRVCWTGRYSKGEEGSPVIAIKAVIEQPRPIKAKVDFHFIELDKRRSDHLAVEIGTLKLPPHVAARIHGGQSFQDRFPEIWNSYAQKPGRSRPPTFVFIDPFGFKIPFSYVADVLHAQSCEVLITFMFEEINRFLSQGEQPDNFDNLFGCRDWREGVDIKLPSVLTHTDAAGSRPSLARMDAADAVQTKGFGSVLCSAR
jgi:three-Cys-motif partner protein